MLLHCNLMLYGDVGSCVIVVSLVRLAVAIQAVPTSKNAYDPFPCRRSTTPQTPLKAYCICIFLAEYYCPAINWQQRVLTCISQLWEPLNNLPLTRGYHSNPAVTFLSGDIIVTLHIPYIMVEKRHFQSISTTTCTTKMSSSGSGTLWEISFMK